MAYLFKPTCMQKAPVSACVPVLRCLGKQPKAQSKQRSCLSWARRRWAGPSADIGNMQVGRRFTQAGRPQAQVDVCSKHCR